ncbi:MAG: large-conductance mechanosensitive channel protein MscL [bacterium]
MGIGKEFKEFAMKGNVMDMAVGIIIGAAFGKIVASLVNDVIMPPIGMLIGGVNFSDLAITLKEKVAATATTPEVAAVLVSYGKFLQTVVDFMIVAFVIFIVIKGMNSLHRNKQVDPPKAA